MERSRLKKACEGKSKTQGGYNVTELKKIYTGMNNDKSVPKTRKGLLDKICEHSESHVTTTSDERLVKACQGKTYSQGGYNITHLKKLANVTTTISRVKVLEMLCERSPLLHTGKCVLKSTYDASLTVALYNLYYLKKKHKNVCVLGDPSIHTDKHIKNITRSKDVMLQIDSEYNLFAPPKFWEWVDECIHSGTEYILFPFKIRVSGAHLNFMIYDVKTYELERFDPHGEYTKVDNAKIDKIIISQFKKHIKIKKYYGSLDFCPSNSFQKIEGDEMKQLPGDPRGFCQVWCFWYADLRMSNRYMSRDEVVKKAIKKIGDGQFTEFIRNYGEHFMSPINKCKRDPRLYDTLLKNTPNFTRYK